MKLLGPFLAGLVLTVVGLGLVAFALIEPVEADAVVAMVAPVSASAAAAAGDESRPVRDVTPPGVTRVPVTGGTLVRVESRLPGAAAAPSGPPRTRLSRVIVVDAGHFRAIREGAPLIVRLAGIDAPAFDARCGDAVGGWRCGAAARAELARLIGMRAVECALPTEQEPGTAVADCSVGGRDLATWLVGQGWATPAHDAPAALAEAAEAARIAGLGMNRPPEMAAAI